MSLTKWIISLSFILFNCPAHALENDKTRPIYIEANQVDMAEKSGISTYSGDVKLKQGSIKINADSITVYTQNKKLQRIIATGAPALFSQRPNKKSDAVFASAQLVEYSSANGKLLLSGEAKMKQGANSFSGNKIEYDTINDVLSAKSSKNRNHRVKAVIQPDTFRDSSAK